MKKNSINQKKWTHAQDKELLGHAKSGAVGSPKSEAYWRSFAPCKKPTGHPNHRTPNGCKTHYLALAKRLKLDCSDSDDPSCKKPRVIVNLTDDDDSDIEVTKVTEPVDRNLESNSSASFDVDNDKSDIGKESVATLPELNLSKGNSLESKDPVFKFTDADVKKRRQHKKVQESICKLFRTIEMLYRLATSTIGPLDKTCQQQLTDLFRRYEDNRGVMFAKLASFNVFNAHQCTKYYLMKSSLSNEKNTTSSTAMTNAIADKVGRIEQEDLGDLNYHCKLVCLSKDLKLGELSDADCFTKICSFVQYFVAAEATLGKSMIAIIRSTENPQAVTADVISRLIKSVTKAEVSICLPQVLSSGLESGDVLVMINHSENGHTLRPLNPISRCRRIIIIKRKEFDPEKYMILLSRRHTLCVGLKKNYSVLNLPIYNHHQKFNIALGTKSICARLPVNLKSLKLLIHFENQSGEELVLVSTSDEAFSYELNTQSVLKDTETADWYCEIEAKNPTVFLKFNVKGETSILYDVDLECYFSI